MMPLALEPAHLTNRNRCLLRVGMYDNTDHGEKGSDEELLPSPPFFSSASFRFHKSVANQSCARERTPAVEMTKNLPKVTTK